MMHPAMQEASEMARRSAFHPVPEEAFVRSAELGEGDKAAIQVQSVAAGFADLAAIGIAHGFATTI
jgi:hypothetical protein